MVIDIHAIGNRLKAAFCGESLHHLKELVFAVEAALAIIADVFRPVHFAVWITSMAIPCSWAKASASCNCVRARLGESAITASVPAQNLVRHPGQICGIDAAGVRDQRAAKLPERVFQAVLLGGQIHI